LVSGLHPLDEEESGYVEEACFYLSELRAPVSEIASQLELSEAEVDRAIGDYKKKIAQGKLAYDPEAREFWSKNRREGGGDERITLVDEKGRFYHGWKSEFEKMSVEQLFELLVVNKKYSDSHPLSEFSKTQPVVGYDPIIPLRNIRKAVVIIEGLLQKRELEEGRTEDV
jgi:hypothetical protein